MHRAPTTPSGEARQRIDGDHVKELRLGLGLSQAGLARLLALSPGTVANWERTGRLSRSAQILVEEFTKKTSADRERLAAQRRELEEQQRKTFGLIASNYTDARRDLIFRGDRGRSIDLDRRAKRLATQWVEGLDLKHEYPWAFAPGVAETEIRRRIFQEASKLAWTAGEFINNDTELDSVLTPELKWDFVRKCADWVAHLVLEDVREERSANEAAEVEADANRYRYLRDRFPLELARLLSERAKLEQPPRPVNDTGVEAEMLARLDSNIDQLIVRESPLTRSSATTSGSDPAGEPAEPRVVVPDVLDLEEAPMDPQVRAWARDLRELDQQRKPSAEPSPAGMVNADVTSR